MRWLKKILPGLTYILAGLLFLWIPADFEMGAERIAGILCLCSSLLFLYWALRKRHLPDLLAFAADFLLGLLFLFSGPYLFTVIYSIYLCAIGIIYLIQWILDHYPAAEGVPGFLYLAAGAYFLMVPQTTGIVFGTYLLILGLQNWLEDFLFSSKASARYWTVRNFVSLPCFLVGVLPAFLISRLQDQALKQKPVHYSEKKNDLPVNLRVFIHTGTRGRTLYGHMTFACDDIMYSYGDYNTPAEKLFKTIGPGIFFTVNSPLYCNNCCVIENSPLFEYGLHLDEKQLQAFEPMRNEIFASTTPWQCPLETLPVREQKSQFPHYESMYANRLWYRTRCDFREYTEGRWHWYTLLGNNCSNWSASKLNRLGLNLPIQKSIVSPGEYYEVFEAMFRDPDSCVVSRAWHDAKVPSTLYTIDGIPGYAGTGTGAVKPESGREIQRQSEKPNN